MTASELGHAVEYELLQALLNLGLEARHATETEDWNEHFDLVFYIGGYEVRVDVTISKAEYQAKLADHPVGVIPVLVGGRDSTQRKLQDLMRQVVRSLRGPVVKDLLAYFGQ